MRLDEPASNICNLYLMTKKLDQRECQVPDRKQYPCVMTGTAIAVPASDDLLLIGHNDQIFVPENQAPHCQRP